MHPNYLLNLWLEEEKLSGSQFAQHAVLSTVGLTGAPHSRVVAIREIEEDHILFFTQKKTRKVTEINACKDVSFTFWFEHHAREVIVEGEAVFLSQSLNEIYWNSYPQRSQIRFCSYAPTSGSPIEAKSILEDKKRELEQVYGNDSLPVSPDYVGISVIPKRYVFYTYRLDQLSDVVEYQRGEAGFVKQILSP